MRIPRVPPRGRLRAGTWPGRLRRTAAICRRSPPPDPAPAGVRTRRKTSPRRSVLRRLWTTRRPAPRRRTTAVGPTQPLEARLLLAAAGHDGNGGGAVGGGPGPSGPQTARLSVTGTVFFDRNEDGYYSYGQGSDDPAEGVTVRLRDQSGDIVDETGTDADGRFFFAVDPSPDFYQVVFAVTPRYAPTLRDVGGNTWISEWGDSDVDVYRAESDIFRVDHHGVHWVDHFVEDAGEDNGNGPGSLALHAPGGDEGPPDDGDGPPQPLSCVPTGPDTPPDCPEPDPDPPEEPDPPREPDPPQNPPRPDGSRVDFGLALDTDGDGLSDVVERSVGSDVRVFDTSRADEDGDGWYDFEEALFYGERYYYGEDGEYFHISYQWTADSDGDGASDRVEWLTGSSPWAAGEHVDADADRLPDAEEIWRFRTDPADPDTDGDLRTDYEEIFLGGSSPLSVDTDGDGLSDLGEWNLQTDPRNSDADGDGTWDGAEYAQGSDPADPDDLGEAPDEHDGPARLRLTVGDDSGSHSEKYRLRAGDHRLETPFHGELIDFEYNFKRGKDFRLALDHLGSRLDEADFDWTAKIELVDGPGAVLYDDYGFITIGGDNGPGADNDDPWWAAGLDGYLWVPGTDLDAFTLDGEAVDDAVEHGEGVHLLVNGDDDDRNDRPDRDDAKAEPDADDDLLKFTLRPVETSELIGHYVVTADSPAVRLWYVDGDALRELTETVELDAAEEWTLYAEAVAEAEEPVEVTARFHIGDDFQSGRYEVIGPDDGWTDVVKLNVGGYEALASAGADPDRPRAEAMFVFRPNGGQSVDEHDGEAVEFELFHADGASTGLTGADEIENGTAFARIERLPNLVIDSGRAAYYFEVRWRDVVKRTETFEVLPGLPKSVSISAETRNAGPRPGRGTSIQEGESLRPLKGTAEKPGGRLVTLTAEVRDKEGNAVADGTAVSWSFSAGTFTAASAAANRRRWETEVRHGKVTIDLPIDQIAPHTLVTVVAGGAAASYMLNGGPVRLELRPDNGGAANPWLLFFDEPAEKQFAVRVTDEQGTPVEAGTVVHWRDAKGLLVHPSTVTGEGGWTQNVMALSGNGLFHGQEVLGKNPFHATVAGYTIDGVMEVAFRDADAAATISIADNLLAGDVADGGAGGTVSLPTTDVTPGDAASAFYTHTDRRFRYETSTAVTLRGLEPGSRYRVRLSGNEGELVAILGASDFYEFTTNADGTFALPLTAAGRLPAGSSGVTAVGLTVERPVGGASGTTWLPVTTGHGRGVTTRVGITGAVRAARLRQTAGLMRQAAWGALVGSDDLDAALAGDIALSFVPVAGAYTDVRDIAKNVLRALPLDLGLGEPDWREAAIAGFGLAAEFLPPADYVVDAYRTLYKVAKASTAAMPFFLSVEPLFTGALKKIFVDGDVGADPPAGGPPAESKAPPPAAFSGGGGIDFGALGALLTKRGMPQADVNRLFELVDYTLVRMITNADVRAASLALMQSRWSGEIGDVLQGTLDALGSPKTADLFAGAYRAAGRNVEVTATGLAVVGRALRDGAGGGVGSSPLARSLADGDAGAAVARFGQLGRAMMSPSLGFDVLDVPDVSRALVQVADGGFLPNAGMLHRFADDLFKLNAGAADDEVAWMLIRLQEGGGIHANNTKGELYELTNAVRGLAEGRQVIAGYWIRSQGAPPIRQADGKLARGLQAAWTDFDTVTLDGVGGVLHQAKVSLGKRIDFLNYLRRAAASDFGFRQVVLRTPSENLYLTAQAWIQRAVADAELPHEAVEGVLFENFLKWRGPTPVVYTNGH